VEAGTAAGELPLAGWSRRGGGGRCSPRAGTGAGEVVAGRHGQRVTSGEEDWARRAAVWLGRGGGGPAPSAPGKKGVVGRGDGNRGKFQPKLKGILVIWLP
jgi:hypothetical protein